MTDKIDWTKPIETTLGEPLHYIGVSSEGLHVVQLPNRRFFNVSANGEYSNIMFSTNAPLHVRNTRPKPAYVDRWLFAFSYKGAYTHTSSSDNETDAKTRRAVYEYEGYTVGPIVKVMLPVCGEADELHCR